MVSEAAICGDSAPSCRTDTSAQASATNTGNFMPFTRTYAWTGDASPEGSTGSTEKALVLLPRCSTIPQPKYRRVRH